MNKRMKMCLGIGAFVLGLCFMLFGPSDLGDNPNLTALVVGAVLGSVVLIGRLIMRKQQQRIDSKQDAEEKE